MSLIILLLLLDSHSFCVTVKGLVQDHDLARAVEVGVKVISAVAVLSRVFDDGAECVVLSVVHLVVLGELDDDRLWDAMHLGLGVDCAVNLAECSF